MQLFFSVILSKRSAPKDLCTETLLSKIDNA